VIRRPVKIYNCGASDDAAFTPSGARWLDSCAGQTLGHVTLHLRKGQSLLLHSLRSGIITASGNHVVDVAGRYVFARHPGTTILALHGYPATRGSGVASSIATVRVTA
jgi:hypothetical protein